MISIWHTNVIYPDSTESQQNNLAVSHEMSRALFITTYIDQTLVGGGQACMVPSSATSKAITRG